MNPVSTSAGTVQNTAADGVRMRLAVLPQARHWVLWPATISVAVLVLGFSTINLPGPTTAEFTVDQFLSAHHTPALNALALTFDRMLGDLSGAILLTAASLYILIVRRAPVNAIAFGAVSGVGWLSCHLIKAAVARPRPDQSLLADPLIAAPDTHSFPSGQVCLATAIAFAMYYLARGTRWQKPVVGLAAVFVLVTALSRLYLGVHYPTDVLASITTTTSAVLYFSGLWNRYAVTIISRIRPLAWFGPIPAREGATQKP
ncbi:phosphatase PAP2 family protein [Pseudarthrobacter phenanthrenivorans]|uniref:phosphatase PAP2 family protein n=1 Tax=Pseudarthrobacter phenanthrenivorans TaxID=361575 RepID=UPI00344C19DB